MSPFEFGCRIEALSGPLRPYAVKLTNDQDDANDLLQETLFKAFANRKKFTEGTNLKAWMYTIMRNTFFTNYQRMVRRKTFVDTTENKYFLDSNSTVENSAYGNLVRNDAEQAIDALKDIHKIPFKMYFEGYKYEEIAKHLAIPIGTVKNRIHIARKELKNALRVYDN